MAQLPRSRMKLYFYVTLAGEAHWIGGNQFETALAAGRRGSVETRRPAMGIRPVFMCASPFPKMGKSSRTPEGKAARRERQRKLARERFAASTTFTALNWFYAFRHSACIALLRFALQHSGLPIFVPALSFHSVIRAGRVILKKLTGNL